MTSATFTGGSFDELGARLREARNKASLTQAELAKRLGVTAGAVGQWEVGLTRPGTDKLRRLATVLDLRPEELLRLSEPRGKARSMAERTVPSPAASNATPQPGPVALDRDLLRQAKELGIDIPAALNAHLRHLVGKARSEQWLRENREALADANAFLDRHGLWSDGKRQF